MLKEIPVEQVKIVPKPEEGEIKKVITDNRTHIFINCGESILMDKLEPCYICKSLTNRYKISYGAPFCSDKCIKKMDKEFYEWCEKGGDALCK